MQLQDEVSEVVEHYTLTASFYQEAQEGTLEYPYKSDVLIVSDSTEIKVVLSSQYQVVHHIFKVADVQDKFQTSDIIRGRDLLRTMTLDEAVDVFLSPQLMSVKEIFDIYRHAALSRRRDGTFTKETACYLYYEVAQIEEEYNNLVRDEGLSLSHSRRADLLINSIAQIHQLGGNSTGDLFNDYLQPNHLEQVTKNIIDCNRVIAVFDKVVWEPLQAQLRPISRNLRKPALSVVK